MKKKIVAMMLVAVMGMSTLTGCAQVVYNVMKDKENSESTERYEKLLKIIHTFPTRGRFDFLTHFFRPYSVMFHIVDDIYKEFCFFIPFIHVSISSHH